MAFNNVNNQLQYIAANGNYVDIANAMALICAYSSVYTTGQVPTIKRLRDGIQASSVANLEAILTGATSQTNSIQDYNKTRDDFFVYVATTNPLFYSTIDPLLFPRICVVETPGFPVNVNDCQGTLIGAAANLTEYLTLWNDQKVDADRAICGVGTDYIFDTGITGYLVESKIQPDNTKIHYNAPAVNNHRQRGEMDANRDSLVDREAEVKPQSIAKYSDRNI
jgi:hypothetical protein